MNLTEPNLDVDEIPITVLEAEENISEDFSDYLTDEELDKEIVKLKRAETEWLDIYKIVIDTRKFEIENFWKRAIFFWGTIALLLAGYFNAKNSEHFLIFVSYIGLFYNLIFSLSLRGSKYWQEHWELASVMYEKALNIRVFRWKLQEQIKENNEEIFFLLRPHKFSVSKLTMILSDMTLSLWVILIIKDLKFLSTNHLLNFDFTFSNSIDYFTLTVILLPILFLTYITIFIISGTIKKQNN